MAEDSSTLLPLPANPSLYVGDLEPHVSESLILQAFSLVVPIKSLHLCRDRLTGQSLRYAYVNFFSHSDASRAMYLLNHTYLNGKPMRIMWSQRNPFVRKTNAGNLFVKNLDTSINSVVLESNFQKFGKILSCKVAEEKGMSKGFGFVQFASEESAMKALEALDGTLLLGKKISVAKFMRKSERQPVNTDTNVYVENLDKDITEDFLQNKFCEYGKVISVAIKKDDQGKSKGFGFICFELPEDANRAVAAMNGAQLGSGKIFAGKALKKAESKQFLEQQRQPVDRECSFTNVYVKNLEMDITEVILRDKFSEYGKVSSVAIMKNDQGQSKGFGFISFESPEDAKKAIMSMNGAELGGKKIFAGKALKKVEREHILKDSKQPENEMDNFTNVYVKNLEQDITEDFLRTKFSAYGKIHNVAIMKDDQGKSKGFGFINFESPEDAKRAIAYMNGAQLGSKKIFAGKAQKKAERKQFLKQQHKDVHDKHFLQSNGSTVYVENLNESINDMELRGIFSGCGHIITAQVARYEDGRSKGLGFVLFSTPSDAIKATALHRTIIHGRSLHVSLSQDQGDLHVYRTTITYENGQLVKWASRLL